MENQIRRILNKTFGKERKHGYKHGEYIYHCPFCNHRKPKLNVSVILDNNNCNVWQCWVCKESGNSLYSLFNKSKQYDALNYIKLINLPKPKSSNNRKVSVSADVTDAESITIPNGFFVFDSVPTESKQYNAFVQSLRYLTETRKLSLIDLVRYNIQYTGVRNDKFSNTFIIPSFDSSGNLNYLSCRKYIDSKYTHIPLSISKQNIGFDNYINWNERYVILVESALDAITLQYNTIPTWGVGISDKLVNKILLNRHIKDVYLFYDADVSENKNTKRKLIKKIFGKGKNIHWITSPNNTDPNDLGFEKSWQLIKHSKPITVAELYT